MSQITKTDFHQKAYVCIEVFEGERPILLVSREDGDWCFLCGAEHPDDASSYRVVGIGHVIERNQDVTELLDLAPNEEAERFAPGQPWIRKKLSSPS